MESKRRFVLFPTIDAMFGRQTGSTIPTTTQPTAQPPATSASLLQSVSARTTATVPPLDSGYSTPSPSTSPRQQPDLDLDLDHPPVDEPSIVLQSAGFASRRRGYVHVRDVRAVQDDRARV